MGHSLAGSSPRCMCTDDRYAKAEGLSLAAIKGCVPVDATIPSTFPRSSRWPKRGPCAPAAAGRLWSSPEIRRRPREAPRLLGGDARRERQWHSAVLILHIGGNPDTGAQARRLASVLEKTGNFREGGVRTREHAREHQRHLGKADDAVTRSCSRSSPMHSRVGCQAPNRERLLSSRGSRRHFLLQPLDVAGASRRGAARSDTAGSTGRSREWRTAAPGVDGVSAGWPARGDPRLREPGRRRVCQDPAGRSSPMPHSFPTPLHGLAAAAFSIGVTAPCAPVSGCRAVTHHPVRRSRRALGIV